MLETNKKITPEELNPVVNEITKRVGLLVAGDTIVIPEERIKQVVDTLHFGHRDQRNNSRRQSFLVVGNERGQMRYRHCVHELR